MRGFIPAEALWAHVVAYAADTLGELARCEKDYADWDRATDVARVGEAR